MTDPFKLPATTQVNLYSNFLPNPRIRGLAAPIPQNFTPTDNASTFDQAKIHNNTNPNKIMSTKNAPKYVRPRKEQPQPPPAPAAAVVKRGRSRKSNDAKGPMFPST